MSSNRVILVVDRLYGQQITALPTSAGLWIIDSPENRPHIAELKAKFTSDVSGDLTWFGDLPEISPTRRAADEIESIEEHYGEHAQRPAYSHLTIVGASPEVELLAAAEGFGFRLASSKERTLEFER
jgi:hypothetical protein